MTASLGNEYQVIYNMLSEKTIESQWLIKIVYEKYFSHLRTCLIYKLRTLRLKASQLLLMILSLRKRQIACALAENIHLWNRQANVFSLEPA